MVRGKLGGPRPLAESNLEILFRCNKQIKNEYVGEVQRRTDVAFADAGFQVDSVLVGPEEENDSIWVMLEDERMPLSAIYQMEKELESDLKDIGIGSINLTTTVISD
jgi:hypothetical protein